MCIATPTENIPETSEIRTPGHAAIVPWCPHAVECLVKMTTRIMFGYLAVVAVGELLFFFVPFTFYCFFPHIASCASRQTKLAGRVRLYTELCPSIEFCLQLVQSLRNTTAAM